LKTDTLLKTDIHTGIAVDDKSERG